MAVSSQKSRDAALLRATTELYLLEAEHDADEVRRFEELATHFLGKVSVADRAFVAERLARHPDAPASVLRMLGKDILEVASPILRHATTLGSFDWIAILAATGTAHARMIAQRGDLAPDVVTALRLTGDAEILATLPAPPEAPQELALEVEVEAAIAAPASFEPATFEPVAEPPVREDELPGVVAAKVLTAALSAELDALLDQLRPKPEAEAPAKPLPFATEPLAARAIEAEIAAPPVAEPAPAEEPETAEEPLTIRGMLARRSGEPPAAPAERLPGAGHFLSLDRAARIAMLDRFALLPEMPRLGQPSALELDRAFHAAVNRARVPALARQRQRAALIETMAAGLDLSVAIVQSFVDDVSGEALVVLLKAIGLTDIEAQQVLLLANPEIGEAVGSFFRLVKLFARLDRNAADHLVRHWREEAKAPVHVPHFAESDQAARAARPVASYRPIGEDVPERNVFGKRGA